MTLLLALLLMVLPVTDDILSRISALEATNVGLRSRVSQLETEAVRQRRASAQGDLTALVGQLDPGSLTQNAPYRGGGERLPALAQPLLARLRDDSALGGVASGKVDSFSTFGNLLGDPTFSTLDAATLTAVANTNISGATPQYPFWSAWYVLNSGTAPATTKTISRGSNRWHTGASISTSNVTSSADGLLVLVWAAAAGDITVYLQSRDYAWVSGSLPSWVTAGVDIRPYALAFSNATTATAYVEIVSNLGVVLAQSDPEDLLNLYALDLRSHLETALSGTAASTEYHWRLRIDVSWPATAGFAQVVFSQPNLAWSEDGSAPPFQPAVGAWVPELSRFHGARAYLTTNQSVNSAADTAILFDTGNAAEEYDTDAFHSLSSTPAAFFAPWAGYYHVDAGAVFAGNGAGIRSIWIEANGSGVSRSLVRELGPIAGSAAALATSCDVYLQVGEYVRLMVNQTSVGALNVLASDRNTFLDIHLVGV